MVEPRRSVAQFSENTHLQSFLSLFCSPTEQNQALRSLPGEFFPEWHEWKLTFCEQRLLQVIRSDCKCALTFSSVVGGLQ